MKDVTTFHQEVGRVALRRGRAARAMCLSLAVILSSGILSTGTVTQVARAQFSTETKLTASDASVGSRFGQSVGLSGNTAIIGAHSDDDAAAGAGAAYLFDVTTGNELFKLTAGDAAGGESFGGSVAISGNIAIVGAEADSDAGTGSGSAYLYNVATGKELFKLTASDAAAFDKFGISVAISDGVAIVGAEGAADNSGSAYAFDVATGNQILKPTASDTALSDRFGRSVAISGSAALIGANGNDDGAGFESGSAYLFASTSLASDLTGNGFVDFEDLTVLLANWNQQVGSELGNLVDPTNTPVNFEDLTVLLAGWTGPGPAGAPEAALAAEAVPEPSGLMLAVAGLCGMGCWRRRRART
ncbi:MAG: FG-GAP repeat protein [Planctomycetes bacterium]|nr:FG-GAP repeat protein [Planctomycetota bacterium]